MKSKKEIISYLLLISVLAISFLVMFAWFLRWETIIQINSSWAPMQFNTALCFFFTSAGILLERLKKNKIAFCIGLFIFIIATATGLQYIFEINLGLDNLIIYGFIDTKTIRIGRMSPNTALAFMLCGLNLILSTNAFFSEKIIWHFSFGVLIFMLGLISLFGYIFNIESAYCWGNLNHMAIHTAFLFSCIGIVLLSTSQLNDKLINNTKRNVAIFSFFIFVLLGMLVNSVSRHNASITREVYKEKKEVFSRLLENELKGISNEVRINLALFEMSDQKEKLEEVRITNHHIVRIVKNSKTNDFSQVVYSSDKIDNIRADVENLGGNIVDNEQIYLLLKENISPKVIIFYWVDFNRVLSHISSLAFYQLKDLGFRLTLNGTEQIQIGPFALDKFSKIENDSLVSSNVLLLMSIGNISSSRLSNSVFFLISVLGFISILIFLFYYLFKKDFNKSADYKLMKDIFDASNGKKFLVNQNGEVVLLNSDSKQYFNYNLVNHSKPNMLIDIINHKLSFKDKIKSFEQIKKYNIEKTAITADDLSSYQIDISRIVFHDELHYIVLLYDITQKVLSQALLEKQRDELDNKNSELSDFAYSVSHDLKAPLRGISQVISWLKEDLSSQLNEKNLDYFELIESKIIRLNQYITGMLQMGKINNENYLEEEIDLRAELTSISEILVVNTNCVVNVDDNLPHVFVAKILIIQLFQNLIENAIKYSSKEAGRVGITYFKTREFLVFQISDNGDGVEKEHHERIFQIFQQLDSTKGGIGLGLAIVKKIVKKLNGKIQLDSELNVGTIFKIFLPISLLSQRKKNE